MENNIDAAIKELVKGPNIESKLVNEMSPEVKLLEEPKVMNGQVTLNFNESIYGSLIKRLFLEHVLDSLVLSLTEQSGIEGVVITVNGKAELETEKGKKFNRTRNAP